MGRVVQEAQKLQRPTVAFEREAKTGSWKATARTAGHELVANGETLREARLALEQLLRIERAESDGPDRG